MYENKCAICGQPILGYWYEIGKKNICQSCAASTTVYDLFQRDIIDIKPDIVESEASLVTKDDGYHYTDEDVATALKLINEIKSRGFNTEREFFDECRRLWDAGASDTDNSLLILRKRYEDIMPSPRYEGDTGNDTWDVMYHLWQPDSDENNREEFDWDYVDKFKLTDDIKRRVDGLYEDCAAKWKECHDKDEVYKLHERLADELVEEYKVPRPALGIAEPAYVRSDGTINCVPDTILMGGGSGVTNEECELQDDIENMSEDDFLSKYVDNSDAIAQYQDWHRQFN